MNVKIKKVREDAILPKYANDFAAGADLYNCEKDVVIKKGQTAFVGSGVAMAIPQGYVGLIFARSGLSCKQGIAPANKVGVIDSDYRGEIIVALHNHSEEERVVKKGDRMAQIVVVPYLKCNFEEGELEESERGAKGFGSSGK